MRRGVTAGSLSSLGRSVIRDEAVVRFCNCGRAADIRLTFHQSPERVHQKVDHLSVESRDSSMYLSNDKAILQPAGARTEDGEKLTTASWRSTVKYPSIMLFVAAVHI